MALQYQSLKQEAQIYENLTGKKCSIYHEKKASQQKLIKLPSATKRRVMTIEESQQNLNKCNSYGVPQHTSIDRYNEKSNDLFSKVLRQGIKMRITDDNNSFISNVGKARTKTCQIKKKEIENPQKTQKKNKVNSLRNEYSVNKINSAENKPHFKQNIAASSPIISNHQSILAPIQERRTSKNNPNFLTLNKQNFLLSKKNTKTTVEVSATQGLIGWSKKERLLLEQRNKEQSNLQDQIKQYHHQTKEFMDKMKTKYHFNLTKQKKYLKKVKHESIDTNPENVLINQAIRYDQLSQEITYLNLHFKQNSKALQALDYNINNNTFDQFLHPKKSIQNQSIIQQQEQDDTSISFRKKMSILEKLTLSLNNMRLKNKEDDQQASNSKPVQPNERLRQLLFD